MELADSLVQIPFKRWAEVRDTLASHWPHGVPAFYALQTQLQHPELGATYNVQLFCPFGRVEDGVVLFNNKGALDEVIILTNNGNSEKLEQALVTTKRIDWSIKKCVPWADTDVVDLMKRVEVQINLKVVHIGPTIKDFLSRESKPYENLQCPPNTYMGSLKIQNVDQVNTVWPHRYQTSPKLFETLIKNQLSYGLFSKEDDVLLAWVFLCEVGFLTHLYCEVEHRKKGYAEFVTKYVINDQLSQGKDIFCYIVEDNMKSLNLFKKLNFERIGRGVWMVFVKE